MRQYTKSCHVIGCARGCKSLVLSAVWPWVPLGYTLNFLSYSTTPLLNVWGNWHPSVSHGWPSCSVPFWCARPGKVVSQHPPRLLIMTERLFIFTTFSEIHNWDNKFSGPHPSWRRVPGKGMCFLQCDMMKWSRRRDAVSSLFVFLCPLHPYNVHIDC